MLDMIASLHKIVIKMFTSILKAPLSVAGMVDMQYHRYKWDTYLHGPISHLKNNAFYIFI